MDVKSISIEVSAKGLVPATKALDNLGKAAGTASPVVQELQRQLEAFSKASLGSIVSQLSTAANGVQRLRNATKDMSNTGQSFKGLSNATTSIATAMERLVASTSGLVGFNDQLSKTAAILSQMKGDAGVLSTVGRSAAGATVGGGKSASGSGTSEADALTKKQQNFLKQLEYQTVLMEKGKIGALEFKAAQLGVAGSASTLLDRMKNSNKVLDDGVVVSKQYKNAVRQIPAQFTDIATQLAGGQNPFLILLQQGGQIKDMFGGSVPDALRATGNYIGKALLNPVVLAAAALGTLTYGVVAGSNELGNFNKALALTNNYIGLSSQSFYSLASQAAAMGNVTKGQAAEALTALASSGKITTANIVELTASIANFSARTGQDIKKVVEEFASLSDSPSKAISKLDEKYHFLTASVYLQIKALEDQGKKQEAVALAQKTFESAVDTMSKNVTENLGYIEKGWVAVKDTAKSALDVIKDFGRDKSVEAQADSVSRLAGVLKTLPGAAGLGTLVQSWAQQKKQAAEAESAAKAAADAKQAEADRVQKTLNEEVIAAANAADGYDKLYTAKSKQVQIDKQIEALQTFKKGTKDQKEQEDTERRIIALQQERVRVMEAAQEKTNTRNADALAGLDAEIRALNENIAGYESKGAAYDKLTEKAKQLYAVEFKLQSGKYDPKTVAGLEEQRVKLTEIVALEKTQTDLQESAKREKTYKENTQTLTGQIKAIEERNAAMQRGEFSTATLTEAEKRLGVVQEALTKATTTHESAALLDEAAMLRRKIAAEATGTSLNKLHDIEVENNRVKEQSTAQYDALIAKYQQEQDAMKYSEAELSKLTAIRQIEVDTAKKVAEAQAEINNLKKQEGSDNSGQIAALQERIDILQTTRDKMVDLVNNQPNYKQLFGESGLQDMKNGFTNFYNSLSTSQQLYQSAFQQGYSLMSNTLSTFFKTGEFNAKEWAANMLSYITDVVTQMLVLKAIQATVTGITPASGVAGGVGAGYSYTASQGLTGFATGGAFDMSGVTKYAKGGAFTNSVVSRPTFFASGGTFGSNLNVMGEAGPEAVMPLTRNAQGDLSVNATGMGGGSIQVNVSVNSDGSSTTSTSDTSDAQLKQLGAALGDRIRQVIVTEQRPGGLLASR